MAMTVNRERFDKLKAQVAQLAQDPNRGRKVVAEEKVAEVQVSAEEATLPVTTWGGDNKTGMF